MAEEYAYPIYDLLPPDATHDELTRFAETVLRLVSEWIEASSPPIHGQSGLLLSASLDWETVPVRLRLRYESHAGGEYDAYLPLQDEEDPASPAELGGLVSADWGSGGLHSDDDPYWLSVARQREAIAAWHDAFPEASAAYPKGWAPKVPIEQLTAAVEEWRRRFPEAAARRAEVYRSVEEFMARER